MHDWRALQPEDRLTYLVGHITRSAVDLDAVTRTAYATLSGDNPHVAWDAVNAMKPRIEKLQTLVATTPDLDEGERVAAGQALEDALVAYQGRSRFVHDKLISSSPEQDEWFMSRLDRRGTPTPLSKHGIRESDLVACERRLVRSGWRMWALSQLVKQHRAEHEGYLRQRWLHLLSNDFEIDDDDNITYNW